MEGGMKLKKNKGRGGREGGREEEQAIDEENFSYRTPSLSLVTRTSEGALDSETVPCSVLASPCPEVQSRSEKQCRAS